MARITIEELYRGDEYNVMGNAVAELMTKGKETNDTRTALELLLVKHTVLAVQKAQANGDTTKYNFPSTRQNLWRGLCVVTIIKHTFF